MPKILHIAHGTLDTNVWTPAFRAALAEIGPLNLVEQGGGMEDAARAALIRETEILLVGWGAAPIPQEVVANPGALRYVCNVTGEMKRWVPPELVEAGIPVTNWGDAPAGVVAEGAMTLLLAVLKDLHQQVEQIRHDGWTLDATRTGGSIDGLRVGIYGCGVIGRAFIELIRPFRPVLRVFDPYARELPEGCLRAATLEELFDHSQAIVIHAGLNDETRGSVTADLLRRLPRHGVVINTARGGIVDQEALFAELASGRLRAGLDVLEPDTLPAGHPARSWTNCFFTAHQVSRLWPSGDQPASLLPPPAHRICLDNLRRYAAGEPLRFRVDPVAYRRQT